MKRKLLFTLFSMFILFSYSQLPTYLPQNGLEVWYPFNNNFNDESGNEYNGSLVGTVPFITDRNGNSNSAIQGGSGYIPTSNQFFRFSRTDSFTVSVWFTVPESGCSGRLLSTESPEGHFRIANYGSGQIAVQFGEYIFPSIVTTDEWHHLVYVYDNRNEYVYIDGELDITEYELEMSENLVYNTPFTIGAKASSAYDKWCGNIDDLGVWNRPLTSQEVTQLYSGSTLGTNTFMTLENEFKLYPNPTNDVLQINSKTPITRVEIYSILGEKVDEVHSDFKTISTDNLSSGMYILRIHSVKGVTDKKLIKK